MAKECYVCKTKVLIYVIINIALGNWFISLLFPLQVAKEVEAIADKLTKECAKGTYKVKRTAAPRPLSSVEASSPQNTTNSPSM